MNDDLDEEIIGAEDGFDEFSQKSNLGDTVRQSPVAKIGIVVGVVAVLAGIMYMFGGEAEKDVVSSVPQGAQISGTPGDSEDLTPAYVEAVEQQNEADLEVAIREGGSAIPVPIDTPDTRLEVPEAEQQSEDPLHRWRVLQEERVERQMRTQETELEPVTVLDAEQQSEAINALTESMMQQMESVLGATTETRTFSTRTLITYNEEGNDNGGNAQNSGGGNGDSGTGGFEDVDEETVIIPAGKIVYAQLLIEANSDVPGSVLAQMLSGPLKGWKMLGEFTLLEDIGMLAISFNTAVNDEGKQYGISAVMLDPDTSLPAMRTSINHKFVRRIVLPAAAAFVEGFSSAIAESGRTEVTVSGDTVVETEEEASNDQQVATGVEEAGQEIREILDEMGDVDPRVIIEAGTPLGVFFTENVVETEEDAANGI